jgi:hypothetical protein
MNESTTNSDPEIDPIGLEIIALGHRVILGDIENPHLRRAIMQRSHDFMFRYKEYGDHTDYIGPYKEYSEYHDHTDHSERHSDYNDSCGFYHCTGGM